MRKSELNHVVKGSCVTLDGRLYRPGEVIPGGSLTTQQAADLLRAGALAEEKAEKEPAPRKTQENRGRGRS